MKREAFVRACLNNSAARLLHPGVPAVLATLRALGVKLGIVTSLSPSVARPLLEKTGLAEQVEVVVDASLGPPYKPHPRPLLHALSLLGSAPGPSAAYVGDLEVDARAARNAGIGFIWASYGYAPKPVNDCDAVIQRFSDLLKI